jgi:branched-subunit amino acid transport protein
VNVTAVILTVGLGTYLLRASMFVVLGGRTPPQWLQAPLAYVGPAGIAALVGALLLTTHGHVGVGAIPAVVAAVSAFAVVRRTGNVMHAFAVGMPVFWTLTVLGV